MKSLTRKFFVFAYTLAFSLLLGSSCASAHILRVTDGKIVPFSEFIDDLKTVRVIFLGELHDDFAHHQAQLQIIRALKEDGIKIAIGLEMFRSDDQTYLDHWVAGDMTLEDFLPIYWRNWSFWDQYKAIYMYARDNGIPMIGLNLSRQITRQVARDGFNSLSEEQLKNLPPVRCIVDPEYRKFIERALGGPGHHSGSFNNFCEAQLLWDKVMAKNLVAYLRDHPNTTVVVLAGSGHSWKHGIPKQLKQLDAIPFRVVLPELPGRVQEQSISPEDADYLLLGVDQGPLH